MLVNPGGPGEPGRSLAGDVAAGISPQVAATYDIVGFDPRGVGGSSPALSCDPNFFKGVRPDYIPANAAAEQVLINRAKSYAAACEQRYGWFLPYETTVEHGPGHGPGSARPSASSRSPTTASPTAPTWARCTARCSRATSAGWCSTPPWTRRAPGTRTTSAQDYAFQGRHPGVLRLDREIRLGLPPGQPRPRRCRRLTTGSARKLEKTPIDGPDGPLIGPDELDDTILLGGYLNAVWPAFAQALSQYRGDGSSDGLVSQYEQWGVQSENTFAVYNAVECADVNWPRNWAKWQSDTVRVYKTAPFEAWDNAWFNAACAFWPVQGPAKPFQVNGAKLPPVLMLQGTLDAATPYAGAQNAHKLLPERPHGRGGGRRQPRPVARDAARRLRAGLPQQLPGHRRRPRQARAGQRHLRSHTRPGPVILITSHRPAGRPPYPRASASERALCSCPSAAVGTSG